MTSDETEGPIDELFLSRLMTSEEAIDFLREHQPMPPEEELSEDLITRFDEARHALERDPDPRGLPLLLSSLGEGSGLGVYQLLDDTLRAYDREDVVRALSETLRSSVPSVRSWSMEFALDYPDRRLIPPAVALLRSEDRDARFFAAAYLADHGSTDPRAREALRDATRTEDDPEIRQLLRRRWTRADDEGTRGMTQPSPIFPILPWPFPDEAFPRQLAAVVMDSVLDGRMPTLQVVHFPGGEWGIADGVDQPTEHNCTLTHIWHVLEQDDSLNPLASLPPGYQADRNQPDAEWEVTPYQPGERYGLRDRLRFFLDIIRFGEVEAEKRRAGRFPPHGRGPD